MCMCKSHTCFIISKSYVFSHKNPSPMELIWFCSWFMTNMFLTTETYNFLTRWLTILFPNLVCWSYYSIVAINSHERVVVLFSLWDLDYLFMVIWENIVVWKLLSNYTGYVEYQAHRLVINHIGIQYKRQGVLIIKCLNQ